jgi:hypothetical protein
MKNLNQILAAALLFILLLPLQADEKKIANAYHLTFLDKNGVKLAEAEFISPEFTVKEQKPRKVMAKIRLLENSSTTEGAKWLRRLLKPGEKVKIEIATNTFETNGGETVAITNIEFNPDVADANISAQYSDSPGRKERSWAYGIFSGGFEGGNVTFKRIRLAEQAAGGNGGQAR